MQIVPVHKVPEKKYEEWYYERIGKNGASKRIREITGAFQRTYAHVKRVKPEEEALNVLVCPVGLREKRRVLEILNLDEKQLQKVEVPVEPPENAEEMEKDANYWPCASHQSYKHEEIDEEIRKRVENLCEKSVVKQSGSRQCSEMSVILESAGGGYVIFGSQNEQTNENLFEHTVISLVETTSQVSKGYLCTGRTVILSNEPCLTCGMALVHSRVGEVFIVGEPSEDSPYIQHHIHGLKELNHRFRVYRVTP